MTTSLNARLSQIRKSYDSPVAVTVAINKEGTEPFIIHTERLKDFLSHPEREDEEEDAPEKFKELRKLEYFG